MKQTGKGVIVGQQWILDSFKQNRLLPEKNYELKGSNNTPSKKDTPSRTSERKSRRFDDEENEEPLTSKDVTRKPSIKKKMTTFDDEDDDEEDEPPVTKRNTKGKIQAKQSIPLSDGNLDREYRI